MGVNIADVERVVIWRIPITKSIADIWQRVGRGGRGEGRTSTAYIMLPYWLFGERSIRQDTQSKTRPYRPSQLSQVETPGDKDSLDDSQADSQVETSGDNNPQEGDIYGDKESLQPIPKYWTKAEVAARQNVPPALIKLANSRCYRQGFLEALGEYEAPVSGRVDVLSTDCCSNNFIYQELKAYVQQRAEELYTKPGAAFRIPGAVYLSTLWQIAISNTCITIQDYLQSNVDKAASIIFDKICFHIPELRQWEYASDNTEVTLLVQGIYKACNAADTQLKARAAQPRRGLEIEASQHSLVSRPFHIPQSPAPQSPQVLHTPAPQSPQVPHTPAPQSPRVPHTPIRSTRQYRRGSEADISIVASPGRIIKTPSVSSRGRHIQLTPKGRGVWDTQD